MRHCETITKDDEMRKLGISRATATKEICVIARDNGLVFKKSGYSKFTEGRRELLYHFVIPTGSKKDVKEVIVLKENLLWNAYADCTRGLIDTWDGVQFYPEEVK